MIMTKRVSTARKSSKTGGGQYLVVLIGIGSKVRKPTEFVSKMKRKTLGKRGESREVMDPAL